MLVIASTVSMKRSSMRLRTVWASAVYQSWGVACRGSFPWKWCRFWIISSAIASVSDLERVPLRTRRFLVVISSSLSTTGFIITPLWNLVDRQKPRVMHMHQEPVAGFAPLQKR